MDRPEPVLPRRPGGELRHAFRTKWRKTIAISHLAEILSGGALVLPGWLQALHWAVRRQARQAATPENGPGQSE
jgi:hypothetical protein